MNKVAQIRTNYRNTTITDNEDYVKYEIYVPRKLSEEFESELLNKECWTWCSKTEAKVL